MSDTHLLQVLRPQFDDLRHKGLYKQERHIQSPQGPDIAVGEGTYSVVGAGPDGKPMTSRGHYLNTIIKKENAWRIAGNTGFVPQRPRAAAKPAAKTN